MELKPSRSSFSRPYRSTVDFLVFDSLFTSVKEFTFSEAHAWVWEQVPIPIQFKSIGLIQNLKRIHEN